ncbi:endocardial fibroelastosis 2, partial [Basidiobolus meristosporus CBS 931.73]
MSIRVIPKNSRLWNLGSSLVMTSVGLLGKMFIKCTTTTEVHNLEPFLKLLFDPNRDRPIITIANHTSVLDDPLLFHVFPLRAFWKREYMRWCLAAREICFTNEAFSLFFYLGQTVPIVRGDGIYQPAVDFAIDRMNDGKWIHIFPEAKVNQTDKLIRFKWGVGRIIMESKKPPIVVPFWHKGMSDIMPEGRRIPIPRVGQTLKVVFGDPIDLSTLLE